MKNCTITIDKIEYTKDEMILYISIVNSDRADWYILIFKGIKNKQGIKKKQCFLKSENKIFYKRTIKNIITKDSIINKMVNGSLYTIGTTPWDSIVECRIRKGGKLTCEIYFPRLPKEIKTVSLVNILDNVDDFSCFNIQIKYPFDDMGDKKEKELLYKMELNKPLTLNNIFFETGKSNLLDSSFAELNTLFNILKSKAKMMIQISGYTDNTGNVQDNIVLSEARANDVKKYLTDKGIDNNRIIVKGYGSSNPKASNDTAEGRAKNRRVEIMVLKNE